MGRGSPPPWPFNLKPLPSTIGLVIHTTIIGRSQHTVRIMGHCRPWRCPFCRTPPLPYTTHT
uniref:Uncharacterized protein n=1 Tax=Cucumis melo TaxID=3656 RepID=A0A9I9CRV1_CUCME